MSTALAVISVPLSSCEIQDDLKDLKPVPEVSSLHEAWCPSSVWALCAAELSAMVEPFGPVETQNQ